MEKRILILQSSVNNKWKVGGFCSTHGYGVHSGHDSGNCADKKDGHDVNTTCSNPRPQERTLTKAGTRGYYEKVGGG